MSMFLLPLVRLTTALNPNATLWLPVVLELSAIERLIADGRVVAAAAGAIQRLKTDSRVLTPASFKSASSPKTVFWSAKQPSWQVACACGQSGKQARTSGMISKAKGQCERFVECFNGRVVVFICVEV